MFRVAVLLLTFLAYTAYHASRKPLSIVKNSREFLDCTSGDGCYSWVTEINGMKEDEAKTMLGFLDTAYLVTYAVFMFVRCVVQRCR